MRKGSDMQKKIDEAKRVKRYLEQREEFSFRNHAKSLILVKKTILKGVSFNFDRQKCRKIKCYLYHFDKLGITSKEMAATVEGKTILIYKSGQKKTTSVRRTKCPWCYAPTKDFEKHISSIHQKTLKNIRLLTYQNNLYSELLRIIRETEYYMSLAFLNAGCQLCDNPVMKGRELCCSIPTSFRNRMRSLNLLGMTTSNIDPKYFDKTRYGQIILLP